jgi:hypothetical protein
MQRGIMTPKDIVEYASSAIVSRKECLDLGLDRGCGEGMQIEKWILTEMLAKLIQLTKDSFVNRAEGEHKYPNLKTTRFEHCDLWWLVRDEEHWLEVKTLVVSDEQQRGSLEEVIKDLEKRHRLRRTDKFHHLVIVFPIGPAKQGFLDLKAQLANIYSRELMTFEADWNYQVWREHSLYLSLHTLARG